MNDMATNATWLEVIQLCMFAGTALLLKILLLTQVRFNFKDPVFVSFLAFVALLLVTNAVEFFAYMFGKISYETSKFLIHFYFFALYYNFPAMLIFALTLGNRDVRSISRWLYGISTFLLVLHISGYMVIDYVPNGYALIRVPGEFYFLFEVFAIACALVTPAVLMRNIKQTKDSTWISKNKIALAGLLPFSIGSIGILSLMHFDVNLSSAVIIPIMTVFLVMVLMYCTRDEVFDLSMNFDLTKRMLLETVNSLSTNPGTLNDRLLKIEKLSIEIALYKTDGVQKDAAAYMGISESTLCRKIARFEDHEISAFSQYKLKKA